MSTRFVFQRSGSDSHDYVCNINPPVNVILDRDGNSSPGLVLKRFCYYYTINNITSSNNILRYSNGSVWRNVEIPVGTYSIPDIISFFNTDIDNAGDNSDNISMAYSTNTRKITITIASSYRLDLSYAGSPTTIMGHSDEITSSTEFDDECDVLNGLKVIHLNCDLVKPQIINGLPKYSIGSFIPAAAPSAYIDMNFDQEKLNIRSQMVDSVRLWITDQNGTLVNLNGSSTLCEFFLV